MLCAWRSVCIGARLAVVFSFFLCTLAAVYVYVTTTSNGVSLSLRYLAKPNPRRLTDAAQGRTNSCRNALLFAPRVADFPGSPRGAKSYVKALLERQVVLQRCMAAEIIPERVLVHRCLPHLTCGGLGDRLRGSALALIIAAITNRALFIEHKKPAGTQLTTYLEPSGHIDWRLSSLSSDTVSSMGNRMNSHSAINSVQGGCSAWAKTWQKLMSTDVVGLESNIPPTRICVAKLFQTLLGPEAFSLVSKIHEYELTELSLHQLYKPTFLVKEHVSGLLAKLHRKEDERRLNTDCTICFHIRTGKNMGTGQTVDLVYNQNFEDFGKCGEMVQSKFVDQKSCSAKRWFVVTDYGNVSSLLTRLSVFSKTASLVTTSSNSLIIHVDRPVQSQMESKERLDRSLLHVFSEFHLLQQCRFLVMSPSQFSLMATLSGSAGDTAVRFTVPYKSGCSPTSLNQHVYPIDEKAAWSWITYRLQM